MTGEWRTKAFLHAEISRAIPGGQTRCAPAETQLSLPPELRFPSMELRKIRERYILVKRKACGRRLMYDIGRNCDSVRVVHYCFHDRGDCRVLQVHHVSIDVDIQIMCGKLQILKILHRICAGGVDARLEPIQMLAVGGFGNENHVVEKSTMTDEVSLEWTC
jgi:hypothetical protein